VGKVTEYKKETPKSSFRKPKETNTVEEKIEEIKIEIKEKIEEIEEETHKPEPKPYQRCESTVEVKATKGGAQRKATFDSWCNANCSAHVPNCPRSYCNDGCQAMAARLR